MWPEITRHCEKDGLKPCDKPKILSRVFHIKLDKLMRILKDKKILGSIKADVYTVEFQKIGLPHAHIILWLFEADKLTSPFDVDQLISAEIPDKLVDPELYELVGSYMVHGPCGRSSRNAPCMKDGKCSKYFPKRYNTHTILDEKGYPTYRRRNDGRTVSRKGVKLDNRFVVPYNARLLKLFCGHLNIEKTNQSRVIKYLFKYISKGNGRVIAGIYNNNDSLGSQQSFDEVSHYLNCRSLNDYSSLPTPDTDNIFDISNQLILQELNYNKLKEREESKRLQRLMTAEQKQVFDEIMGAVSSKKDWFFFLHGFGGTGKTFIWNAFTASRRSNEGIILNVASSGIAATLLPSDRTAHSRIVQRTRLQITQLGKNVVKAKALNGTSAVKRF
ncbi:hypothetical protein K1719_033121 [Acacia pycnantha]|nr:hypothetical protein K1719_033121 [Acacia pycnantha]